LLIWFSFITTIGEDPSATIFIYELNSSVVPQGNSISLTADDFKVFPKLAPVIRDKTQKKAVGLKDDDRILYKIPLTSAEQSTFDLHYGSSGYFEYNGTYYSYDITLN
jgi:hypothetical protein